MVQKAAHFKWRLVTMACFELALMFVLLRATARAWGFGTFSSFAHPWQNIQDDLLIFIFSALIIVGCVPIIIRGSLAQRIKVLILILLPAYAIVTFLFWVLRLVGNV